MCFGAMIHARIERIVFGALDPKTGVCGSCMDLNNENFFNHKISITGGVLEKESSDLLRLFFKSLRDKK
jgi:tRNA(adenine34) deaminase